MGNTPHWGLGVQSFRLVFICIFLVMTAPECAGGGNLSTVACSKRERLALLKFKHGVTDYDGMLSSWVGDDCCRWERVGCDDATGRVVSLDLKSYSLDDWLYEENGFYPYHFNRNDVLSGEVNSCLAELVNLKHLDLAGNDFYIPIPKFIGSLKQLRYLNLSDSGFIGIVPHQIGNLSNLEVLDLSSHTSESLEHGLMLTDDMAWIFGLTKLKHLDLSRLDLSTTKNLDNLLYMIPSLLNLRLSGCGISMANLGSYHHNSSREISSIKHLDLSANGDWFELPGFFLNMTSLKFLDLSYTSNFSSRSSSFQNLVNFIPSVSELCLSYCGMENAYFSPPNLNLSTFSNIQHLDLSWNELRGRIPYVLTNISSLLSLDLSLNMLNSSIPSMPNLLKLHITQNHFREIEDVGMWRHCQLKELIVTANLLKGEIIGPSTNISKCSQNSMEILHLGANKLQGPIPEALGILRSLHELELSYNQLNGSIPESLGRLTALTNMYLESNRLTGPIPISLGSLIPLRKLSMSSNLFDGTLPISIGELTRLQHLDISNNSLQGVVQESHFANLSMLKHLDATSNNRLLFNFSSEWIPPFQLKTLRLGSCKIEGVFPQWLRTQRKLEALVLSNTSIYGCLPTWLRLMPIIPILDLSHNNLTGPLRNLPFVYAGQYEFSNSTGGGILSLQDNLFTGLIPRWLCTKTNFGFLDLSRNKLSGKIPKCLWNMSLFMILLNSNRLSGVIPSLLAPRYSFLHTLQLNDNNLSGELPEDVGFFKNLKFLHFG